MFLSFQELVRSLSLSHEDSAVTLLCLVPG